jgi:hypothetical protein
MGCTPDDGGEQMLRTMLTSRQSAVKVMHDDVTHPATVTISPSFACFRRTPPVEQ